MDLNLTHELLLSSTFGERGLVNNLSGRNSLSLKVCELITLCESSLPEEFASRIFLDADIAVEPDDFLFYDNLGAIVHGITSFTTGVLGGLWSCTHLV